MRISIILAHPRGGSFCHVLADAAHAALVAGGHQVVFHDLHREGFAPLLTGPEIDLQRSNDPLIQRHCDEVVAADGLVFVHPNWWSQPPAMMKGWLDRVLRPGVAYRAGEGGRPEGLLKAKAAVVINTAATAHADEIARYGDPLDVLWRKCVLGICGVTNVRRLPFGPTQSATADTRAGWIIETEQAMQEAFGASH